MPKKLNAQLNPNDIDYCIEAAYQCNVGGELWTNDDWLTWGWCVAQHSNYDIRPDKRGDYVADNLWRSHLEFIDVKRADGQVVSVSRWHFGHLGWEALEAHMAILLPKVDDATVNKLTEMVALVRAGGVMPMVDEGTEYQPVQMAMF